jgi:hypothetical protein
VKARPEENPLFRATNATVRAYVASWLGPNRLFDGKGRVRVVRCGEESCFIAFNSDRGSRIEAGHLDEPNPPPANPEDALIEPLTGVWDKLFEDKDIHIVTLKAFGAEDDSLFTIGCSRDDFKAAYKLGPPTSLQRLRVVCRYHRSPNLDQQVSRLGD